MLVFMNPFDGCERRMTVFRSLQLKRSPVLIWLIIAMLSLLLTAERPGVVFPPVIPLPNGFQPEGLAVGRGTTFYTGSIATGAIYRGDLATGQGAVFVPGQAGRAALGIKLDGRSNRLFVAGGPTGAAFIYDAKTGADVARLQLTTDPATFVNDVVITEDAAYFTDSLRSFFYRVPLAKDGRLPDHPASQEIALSGDFSLVPGAFNSNGIATTLDGKALIIVSSVQGILYRVDPHSGQAKIMDLGGGNVLNGDGIFRSGRNLYVVQNFTNQVSVVQLDPRQNSGSLVRVISSPLFQIPTAIGRFGSRLYVVNARFDTPPTPDTQYDVVRVPGE
jgi:sugar lactone lactonase YvrE